MVKLMDNGAKVETLFTEVRNGFQRVRVPFYTTGPSLTEQSHAEGCDVNNIMQRYEKHGVLDHFNTYQGDYGDFAGVEDYHSSMNKIMLADEMFMTLPATVRERFHNSAAQFVDFAQDPENMDEMRDLGLAPPGGREPPAENEAASSGGEGQRKEGEDTTDG